MPRRVRRDKSYIGRSERTLCSTQLLPLSCEHTHDGSQDRTFTIRPITLMRAPSSDHLITRTMLSLRRTTLAFVAQRTHQELRHITRSIIYHCTTVAYWRFNTCVLSYEYFFFHANIHKTDCEFRRSHDNWSHPIVQQLWKAPYISRPLAESHSEPQCSIGLWYITVSQDIVRQWSIGTCDMHDTYM